MSGNTATRKTLIVYYSFTNNVHTIVSDLRTQIEADVIRVEQAEKRLDYAANNYAIGSAQIQAIRNNPGSASSYPAIDPLELDFGQYGTVIVAAPLWWSNMAFLCILSCSITVRNGRQAYRPDRIERKQRHQRCGVGCQAAVP